MFSDERHLPLVRENLWTVAHVWPALPRVCLVGDVGAREDQFRDALNWWPVPWEFVPYQRIEAAFVRGQQEWFVRFGQHHLFGRKLAAILYSARLAPTLYSDSDVLWISAPRFLDALDITAPQLLVSVDSCASYCREMIDTSSRDVLDAPYACAGVLYMFQWPWPDEVLREWVERALSIAPHAFAEQTIVGLLARRYGGYIPSSDVASYFDDWFHLFPHSSRATWNARHYVGPVRHHFYRDAVLMRCGFLKAGAPAREANLQANFL